jgi:hypothetical protein
MAYSDHSAGKFQNRGTAMKYYVLKNGNLFKILYMDEKTSTLWETEGWESLPCDSNEQAHKTMSEWKSSAFPKANVIPIRREA